LRNERTFSEAHCRRAIGFLPKIRSTQSVVVANGGKSAVAGARPHDLQSSSGSLGVESAMHVALFDGAAMAVNAIGGCVKLKRSERSSSAFVSA